MSSPRAAVDVGSNSVRLLVVDGDGNRLERRMEITRLASGVDETGELDDAALERTLEALDGFRSSWRNHGVVDRVRIAATSAVRDARDRDRFFDGVRDRVGVEPEVLTGGDEAALAFAGVTANLALDGTVGVLDVGGGSTEISIGQVDGQLQASTSLQLGCVRLTERCLHDDPPTARQRTDADEVIAAQLAEGRAQLRVGGVDLTEIDTLVAVAGTATTLAAIHLGLATYDEDRIHGTRVPAHELAAMTQQLLARTSAERARLGPVQRGREDVLHAGAVIIDTVVRHSGVDAMIASESDGLDGLVASLA